MMDAGLWRPSHPRLGPSINLWTLSPECVSGAGNRLFSATNPASATWPTANLAIYLPFAQPGSFVVNKLFVYNGSVAAGNLDVGIYDESGTRIVSTGSTAQSGTGSFQSIDITNTALSPGVYYLALAMDGTTGTVSAFNGLASAGGALGMVQEASAFPLPATATFAAFALSKLPLFGAAGTTLTV